MKVPRTPLSQPDLLGWARRGAPGGSTDAARGPPDGPDPATVAATPVAGWSVLVPRPTGAASPAAAALGAVGATALVVPLIETVPPDDPTDLDDLLLALGSGWYAWLAVTSAAAVPVLVDRASELGATLDELLAEGRVRVAAVGPGTARALAGVHVDVDLQPSGTSNAEGLLADWPVLDEARATHVLFPRGDLAAPTLTDGLRARGWDVDEVVAYRTVHAAPPPDDVRAAWADGAIRAALLTSASTVRALVDTLGAPPPGTLLVAIGPSTAREAERLGLPLAAVAAEQTMTGLVDALVAAARDRTSQAVADAPPDVTRTPAAAPPPPEVRPSLVTSTETPTPEETP